MAGEVNGNLRARFAVDFAGFKLDVDLDLPGQGVTALFGHSGSGKTTVLRCVAGLERTPGGFLAMNGEVWQDEAKGVFVPTYQRPLGYVFQEASLFDHLTVRKNLEYGQKRVPKDQRRVAFDQALELLGIGGLLERRPAGLSGGERQRVGIARALLTSPRILLMDEPLGALDALTREQIQELILDLWWQTRKMFFFITHSVEEALFLATELIVMTPSPGRIAHRYKLDFGKRFIECRDARRVKSDPEFIRLREDVLHLIHAASPAQEAAA